MGPGCLVSPCGKQFTPALSAADSYEMLLKLVKNGIGATFYDPVSDTKFNANPIDILLGQMEVTKELGTIGKVTAFDYLTYIGLDATEEDLHRGWAIECLYEVSENILTFDNILTKEGAYFIRPTRLPCDGFESCFDSDEYCTDL